MGMTLILIEYILLIFSFSYQAQNLYSEKKENARQYFVLRLFVPLANLRI